jgi:hypothetical protein
MNSFKAAPHARYEKLNYYLATFFFDIKNIKAYLKKKSLENSRYKKLKKLRACLNL